MGPQEIPPDAFNLPIEDITALVGRLTLHNMALAAEVVRLRAELSSLSGSVSMQDNMFGKEVVIDGR